MTDIQWVDYPKISLGTYDGEYVVVTLGTASSYEAQIEGDKSPCWHALSSEHGASILDYNTRDDAKRAAEEKCIK